MGRIFGTDGIRGVAGVDMTPELALDLGRAAATVVKERGNTHPHFLIGRDTRISGGMLESAIAAGLCSVGADVTLLGVITTPGVAYLARKYQADGAFVISASHNPYEYNGIKLFDAEGYKFPDSYEEEIEELILDDLRMYALVDGQDFGRIRVDNDARTDYVEYLASTAPARAEGIRVLVDCANGAASATAPDLFGKLPLHADFIFDKPDGVNINRGCGSTHMETLCRGVVAGKYDLGIAFDGDADRCLAVDERGELIDGDQIMAACGLDMKRKGKLPGNAVVATVMSNLGLHLFAKEHGMDLECTSVGDRNVLERMLEKGYAIGGEQSGHMIFLEHATTGDGQLTALQVLALLKESGKRASEVFGICQRYPQVLINIPVADNDRKKAVMASQALADAVAAEEEKLAGEGRVLVRPSGTEALMRVMVEARDQDTAQAAAQRLADQIAAL